MKFLTTLLLLTMLYASCGTTNRKTDSKCNYSQIIYEVSSRGKYEYIKISKTKIVLSSDRNLKNINESNLENNHWKDLCQLLSKINNETFINLKAPTDKRYSDGSANASLSYTIDNKTFITPTFDEGYPPEKIKLIINKILSIKQSVLK